MTHDKPAAMSEERLRALRIIGDTRRTLLTGASLLEACDEIGRLQAENASLRVALRELERISLEAEKESDDLRAALEEIRASLHRFNSTATKWEPTGVDVITSEQIAERALRSKGEEEGARGCKGMGMPSRYTPRVDGQRGGEDE